MLPKTPARPRPARLVDDVPADEDPPPKRRRRRGALLLAGRLVAAAIAALALAMTGGAWQWSTTKNHRLNTVSALDPQSRDIVDPNAQYGDEDFLIVGIDSRAGANGSMGAGDTEDAGGARSDTIMLVNIPANRKRVVAVSFPRDLAITPIQCEAWNPDTGEYGPLYDPDTKKCGPKNVYTETKLNSTFAFGGPKCLVKEIQKLSGLSINRFIAVDFAGFAKMVDAIGGVEVCSTTPLKDYELGTVLAHSGRQLIDSKTALNYVRARNVTTENNGDYGRIKRQQLFLSSLLRSLISKDTFFSLNKLNNVVNMFINDSYVDNVKTKDLVQLGQSVQGMSAGHVSFVTVPTGITDENGDEPPRTSDMRALFDAIINDDPLPGENDLNATTSPPTKSLTSKAAQPQTSTSVDPRPEHVQAVTAAPRDVTVQVSNSTAKSGLATNGQQPAETPGIQSQITRRLPELAQIHHGVLLAGQRAGRRHGRGDVCELKGRADHRDWAGGAGRARLGLLFGRRRPRLPARRSACRSTAIPTAHRPIFRRTCRSPTPPTPPANSRHRRGRSENRHSPRVHAPLHAGSCLTGDRERRLVICAPPTMNSSLNSRSSSDRCAGWPAPRWSTQLRRCCRPTWCWPSRSSPTTRTSRS